MNPIAIQQASLDNALVPSEKRLKIARFNARIAFTSHRTKKYIKSHWKLSSYLIAIQLFGSLLKSLKSTCINELLSFIKELGYSGKCDMLSIIRTDQMHQPWRTFATIINRQISSARKEHMPYPRFTKVIINHFISKDNTISMRNQINLHTIRDDSLLGTLKFGAKTKNYQKYGAIVPDGDSKEESDDDNDEDENDDDNEEDDSDNDEGNDDEASNEDSDQTNLDDENPFFTLKDYEEEEQYEEFVLTLERNKSDDDKMYEEEDDDVAKELYEDLKSLRDSEIPT
nr:hypothetical protein [Tanacetum cinerariifolium]